MHNLNSQTSTKLATFDEQGELFTPLTPTASSHVRGGYWRVTPSYFPQPPRLQPSYSHGRLTSASHQLAAQRLNQALFT